jgi:flagellar hook-associated protein 3 FlgL
MIALSNTRIARDIARQVKLSNAVARTQIEISTGKVILKPSDNPGASARIASIAQAQSNQAAWAANLSLGLSLADEADGVFASVNDRMARASELLVGGAGGATSATDRAVYAKELRSIGADLSALAGTRSAAGDALFASGTALRVRFGADDVFAPVPSQMEMFDVGGKSLSQIVSDAADALDSGDRNRIDQSLAALERGVSKASDSAAEIGLRAARMARIKEQQIDTGIILRAERSGLEDTDIDEAIARLNQQTLTLDAARAAFARINRQTLFDLLN